jgi:hypothetical protein
VAIARALCEICAEESVGVPVDDCEAAL